MSDICPFCGSKEIKLKTPFINPVTGKMEETWCCKAQAKNQSYIKTHFKKDTDGRIPTMEEISKL